MLASNVDDDIYADTPPAEMESPEFDISSTKCLTLHFTMSMPEDTAKSGELSVSQRHLDGPPRPPEEQTTWHAVLQTGFKGDIQGI